MIGQSSFCTVVGLWGFWHIFEKRISRKFLKRGFPLNLCWILKRGFSLKIYVGFWRIFLKKNLGDFPEKLLDKKKNMCQKYLIQNIIFCILYFLLYAAFGRFACRFALRYCLMPNAEYRFRFAPPSPIARFSLPLCLHFVPVMFVRHSSNSIPTHDPLVIV